MRIIRKKQGKRDAKGSWKERVLRYAVGVPIFLGIYLFLVLLYIHPHWPIDLVGWFILIFAGIPLIMCLEVIGECFFKQETGRTLSNKNFSTKRIAVALAFFIFLASFLILLWSKFASMVSPHFR